ncbi:MAG: iron-siderophore ABC transporter substrate-binding protein, partial [Actinomycetota bacterium]
MLGLPHTRSGAALGSVILLSLAACSGSDSTTSMPAEDDVLTMEADAGAAAGDVADSAEAAETDDVSEETGADDPVVGDVAEVDPVTDADPAEDVEEVDADATTPASPEFEVGAFPRVVTDALGEVEITEAPQRVVALDRSLVDAALALGLEVVGYTTFMDPNGALPDYFGEAVDDFAADAEWVGDLSAPNLEAIALLDPDLILTSAVRHESIAPELSAIAPTVMSESAGGGWKDIVRLTGEASGREAAAAAALSSYEARAAELGDEIRQLAGDPTISIVRFVDVIRLYQPISFSGTVLEDAGLSRPESQQRTDDFITIISPEELDQADGDVLIYTVFDNEAVADGVADLQASPLWDTLAAVQRGDV